VHILWGRRSSHPRCLVRQGEAPRSWKQRRRSLEQCPQITSVNGRRERERGSSFKRGGVSSHEKKLEFRFGGKHLDLSECVSLRGAACKGGLWPAVAAMGASSPVGAVQSVTRVLERSSEEGPPPTRNLCSVLSAHAVFRCASSLSGSSVARRSQGRNKTLRGSLPVVWVTSRHGNAKRPQKPHSRARTSRTSGVSVRRKQLQKSVGDVVAQRSANASHLSRGEATVAWPGA